MNKLDIASLNVWGLRDYKKRQEMSARIKTMLYFLFTENSLHT